MVDLKKQTDKINILPKTSPNHFSNLLATTSAFEYTRFSFPSFS